MLACVARLGRHSVPIYFWHCKTELNNSTTQSDINMLLSGQLYVNILEVPFAKLALKILLPSAIASLPLTHCTILLLGLILYVNEKLSLRL